MTYNFDPERWFDNEFDALEARRARGELTQRQLDEAHARLVDEHEKMLDRLVIRYDYAGSTQDG